MYVYSITKTNISSNLFHLSHLVDPYTRKCVNKSVTKEKLTCCNKLAAIAIPVQDSNCIFIPFCETGSDLTKKFFAFSQTIIV